MRRFKRLGAAVVLAAAVSGVSTVGVAGPSAASSVSAYCGHGTGYGYEHRAIIYQGHRSLDGQHQHYYQHDVANWPDHYRWQFCPRH